MNRFKLLKIWAISLVPAVVAAASFALGGTGSVSDAVSGTKIFASDFNKITGALKVDLVPRNSSGIATAEGGNLGTSTYPWNALYFGASASQISIDDSAGSIVFKTGGVTRATITSSGLDLSSLADGVITYSKLNANARFQLRSQVFTSSGTFTVPANVSNVIIVGCGGGGGGGGGGASNGAAGGGGGGGVGANPFVVTLPVTSGGGYTVTIGAGGSAGAAGVYGGGGAGGSGGAGGTTTFGSGLRFFGGNGGVGGVMNGAGGSGGTTGTGIGFFTSGGAGGNYHAAGNNGGNGAASNYSGAGTGGTGGGATAGGGGGGGGAGLGVGGFGGAGGGGTSGSNGASGIYCAGAGGGGGGDDNTNSGGAGGSGGGGFIEVYWVAP
jgi:hypothetical protein